MFPEKKETHICFGLGYDLFCSFVGSLGCWEPALQHAMEPTNSRKWGFVWRRVVAKGPIRPLKGLHTSLLEGHEESSSRTSAACPQPECHWYCVWIQWLAVASSLKQYPLPLKNGIGRGVTPGVPICGSIFPFVGKTAKMELGTPHPPPPEGRGDEAVHRISWTQGHAPNRHSQF